MVVWLYNEGAIDTLYSRDIAYCLLGYFILSHPVQWNI